MTKTPDEAMLLATAENATGRGTRRDAIDPSGQQEPAESIQHCPATAGVSRLGHLGFVFRICFGFRYSDFEL
jgi:hypothetical protein